MWGCKYQNVSTALEGSAGDRDITTFLSLFFILQDSATEEKERKKERENR